MDARALFLAALDADAREADAAEAGYRREAAARIGELERARALAFRRRTLMRAVAAAIERSESVEIAVAVGLATLRTRLGWSSDSEARDEVLTRFAPVVEALFHAAPPAAVGAAVPQPASVAGDADDAAEIASAGATSMDVIAGEASADAPVPDPNAALAAFEGWFLAARGTPFWTLFEVVIPETPLVDF
jgi:hypothetical protein